MIPSLITIVCFVFAPSWDVLFFFCCLGGFIFWKSDYEKLQFFPQKPDVALPNKTLPSSTSVSESFRNIASNLLAAVSRKERVELSKTIFRNIPAVTLETFVYIAKQPRPFIFWKQYLPCHRPRSVQIWCSSTEITRKHSTSRNLLQELGNKFLNRTV